MEQILVKEGWANSKVVLACDSIYFSKESELFKDSVKAN